MQLHLIAFNVPFPANYGGVIDVFYKIKALHKIGVRVYLHCFEYGRHEADELNDICESVTYYKRHTGVLKHASLLPFIVNSRLNEDLLRNLQRYDFPILFEGLHCCGFVNHPSLVNRQKLVRMHNVEWQYYEHLAKKESTLWKRLFFRLESWKLKRFEHTVAAALAAVNTQHKPKIQNATAKTAATFITISPNDTKYFKTQYSNIPSVYVPAFHPNEKLTSKVGKGEYALFHGDLSVKDNEEAAFYLIDDVFKNTNFKLIIAGLNPSEQLLAKANKNIEIQANLSHEAMKYLIQNAHVNILISFHSAGMKLKLLNALFNGRFCVVNHFMVEGTGMEKFCLVGNNASELRRQLKQAFKLSFDESHINKRVELLKNDLSNEQNALKITAQFT
ncbi:MAG: glycosyltransferase [Saprospiraceae bacterium]